MNGRLLHGFRARLLAIVATAALAFVLVVAVSALLSARVAQQLAAIQQNHLPKLELAPKLGAEFERLGRSLQDAVAAQDSEALTATSAQKEALLQSLAAARGSLDPARAAAARDAIDSYYAAALDLSRRMIAGEAGEALVDAAASMQSKQKDAAGRLKQATALDPRELSSAFAEASNTQATGNRVRLLVSIACLALVLSFSLWLSRGVLLSISELNAGLERFGKGDFATPIHVTSADELGRLAEEANRMADSLRQFNEERDRNEWLRSGQAELARELRGELDPRETAMHATRCLARHLDAPAAALYSNESDGLRLLGHYATALTTDGHDAAPHFRAGEGLVGQAALQQDAIVVTDLPPDHLKIQSGLGASAPRAVVLLPLVHAGRVSGVLELALLRPWTPLHAELLAAVRDALAIALEVARSRAALRALLAETQRQAQRLSLQEQELRAANEELQSQQEELRQTNDELTQQTEELEEQRRALEHKNRELHEARASLEQKAEELVSVSAYKSQFLANMSHELRTPLNSMLLLSNLLAENESGNLNDRQVEYCTTIYGAGKDLLLLINQVLDLAKIESGKQIVHVDTISLRSLAEHAERIFIPLAHDKGLELVVELAQDLPATITSDPQRVEQILNNLLGNAIKFTERGSVTLRIAVPSPVTTFRHAGLRADGCIALSVIDTGIGIAAEHQERVFAPFEQAEGTADRRYGGTGLGLTIAREIAGLLGGELTLQSAPGRGSTFTCYLPFESQGTVNDAAMAPIVEIPDLRNDARPAADHDDHTAAPTNGAAQLLVVEDDPVFARAIDEVISSLGLNALVTSRGQNALQLARQYKPSGIILDVKLPDLDGFAVMDKLRADPRTADIPVHFISAIEGGERGMAMGAIGYLTKPASRSDLVRVVESLTPSTRGRRIRVLIIEDDASVAESLAERLRTEAIDTQRATSAREALAAIARERFGCLVLDLSLPDMDGLEFLHALSEQCGSDMPPVVVYTGRALSKTEAQRLEAYAQAVVLKEGQSTDRVIDEVRLFARRLKQGHSPRGANTSALEPTHLRLDGRKILVVDDDMRTVYAMSALLRAKGALVFTADTGRAALEALAAHPEIEAVLMDIMMPEMDGYEAMRRIRGESRFAELPIIALTAKAMKLDREKCLEAGATDYLPKPLDSARLLERLHRYFTERRHAS